MLILLRSHMKVATGLILISMMVLMVISAVFTQRLLSKIIVVPIFAPESSTVVYGRASIMSYKHEAYISALSKERQAVQVGRVVINERFIK